MQALDKAGLVAFVDMITSKGWINSNTGGGIRAAITKVLAETPADTDVRQIDVKTCVLRYNNLHPGELSPPSLKQYEQRVTNAIEQYVSYVSDPTSYKPPSRASKGANGKSEKPKKGSPAATAKNGDVASATSPDTSKPEVELPKPPTFLATEANLVLPFPLRPNYLAQIVIPRDMTKDEAQRLCAFIQALAI